MNKTLTLMCIAALAAAPIACVPGQNGGGEPSQQAITGEADDDGEHGDCDDDDGEDGEDGDDGDEPIGGGVCGGLELHVVGLYDSFDAANNTDGAANVHIDRPGTVVLFLSAYSATDWNVTAGPDTELVEVIAHGYHPQSVNAPSAASVSVLSFETDGTFIGCGYEIPDMDPTSGCETGPLLSGIEGLTGLSVSSFHGCYAMSDVTIAADLSSASNCATDMGYTLTSAVLCGEGG
ncbi:MAG: hypothetical protein IPK82_25305 [Polyangiaceae bacterium]|nr:hypothetical protein [Polyangiaceae bacterium]